MAVTATDASSFGGLANVLVGPEEIVVNGIVGSIFVESSFKGLHGLCVKLVRVSYAAAGPMVARLVYRAEESAYTALNL